MENFNDFIQHYDQTIYNHEISIAAKKIAEDKASYFPNAVKSLAITSIFANYISNNTNWIFNEASKAIGIDYNITKLATSALSVFLVFAIHDRVLDYALKEISKEDIKLIEDKIKSHNSSTLADLIQPYNFKKKYSYEDLENRAELIRKQAIEDVKATYTTNKFSKFYKDLFGVEVKVVTSDKELTEGVLDFLNVGHNDLNTYLYKISLNAFVTFFAEPIVNLVHDNYIKLSNMTKEIYISRIETIGIASSENYSEL